MSVNSGTGDRRPLSIAQIKDRLTINDWWRIEGLPGEPSRSCKSPWRDDKHASFSVYADGQKFKDHGDGSQGDVIDFIGRVRGCSSTDALSIAREHLGGSAIGNGPASGRRRFKKKQQRPSKPSYRAELIDGEVRTAWEAGLHQFRADEFAQIECDEWRGWPAGTSAALADDGLLAQVEWKGQLGHAWLMQYPQRSGWMEIGFHMRHEPRRAGDRAMWTYQPAGVGLPSVPLVLGNFQESRLIVVTEGEWDAATFAAVAGWLDTDNSWPDAVAVIGVRGATGWRTFMEHWRPFWPKRPRFLLIPDNDEAGRKWGADFAGALDRISVSVDLMAPKPGGPKDFNDLHRQQPFSPKGVYDLFERCNLVDERGNPV